MTTEMGDAEGFQEDLRAACHKGHITVGEDLTAMGS
jgi:hypothetical protein